MDRNWNDSVDAFISLATENNVKMLMVGGGAVNFHGYQRHSADVDFWIDTTQENLKNLIIVFQKMGYDIEDFPIEVKEKKQNISVKFSPLDLNLELITNFNINKSFQEAFENSESVILEGKKILKWNVLSLDDLITSKVKSGRLKDLLDVQQLKEINKL